MIVISLVTRYLTRSEEAKDSLDNNDWWLVAEIHFLNFNGWNSYKPWRKDFIFYGTNVFHVFINIKIYNFYIVI